MMAPIVPLAAIPDDILAQAVPPTIAKAQNFLGVMRGLIQYIQGRLGQGATRPPRAAARVRGAGAGSGGFTEEDIMIDAVSETPLVFSDKFKRTTGIDRTALKFCTTRLNSLLRTLEVTDMTAFTPIGHLADLAVLLGTQQWDEGGGFTVLIEPYDDRMVAAASRAGQNAAVRSGTALFLSLKYVSSLL